MDDQFLVEVPEPGPPQGPLLFFVHNRRLRIINAAMIFIALAIPLAIFAGNIHKLASPKISWEFLLAAAIMVFLICQELVLIISTFHLIKPGPTLILYDEGIYDRRLSEEIIPWIEITRMRRNDNDPWQYFFYVSNPARRRRTFRFIHRLSSLIRHTLGRGTFAVNFARLDGDLDAAMRFIIHQLEADSPDAENPQVSENEPAPAVAELSQEHGTDNSGG